MFSHAFDFAVEVVSNRKDATDVTAEMLRAALIQRVRRLTRDELRRPAVVSTRRRCRMTERIAIRRLLRITTARFRRYPDRLAPRTGTPETAFAPAGSGRDRGDEGQSERRDGGL